MKICDFGLARGLGDTTLTDYVETRWYRAPEVILLPSEYTTSIDVWSVGCILCELIGRKPIFTGKDHLDQIRKILAVLGTPSEDDLTWVPAKSPARKFLNRVPKCQKKEWATVYPKASPASLVAVDKMLTFDPTRRATVKAALELPYFEAMHVPSDEPVADCAVDWSFDKFKPTKRLLQNYVYAECCEFHPEIARRDANLLASRNLDSLVNWNSVQGAVCA